MEDGDEEHHDRLAMRVASGHFNQPLAKLAFAILA